MEARKMAAKFAGRCAGCGERFAAGTMILWAKGEGTRHAVCDAGEDAGNRAELELAKFETRDAVWTADDVASRKVRDRSDTDVEVMMLRREAAEERDLCANGRCLNGSGCCRPRAPSWRR